MTAQTLHIKLKSAAIFAGIFIALFSVTTNAATITSAQTGDWDDTNTWVGGVVPGSSDDAVITDEHSVTLTDTRTVNSLTLENSSDISGTLLIISSGQTLTISNDLYLISYIDLGAVRIDIYGTVTVGGALDYTSETPSDVRIRMLTGGTLTLSGAINNYTRGNITTSSGQVSTVTFSGSAAQTIPVSGNSYYNLVINKTGSNPATLSAAVTSTRVRENLTVIEGVLANGGFAIAGAAGKTFSVEDGGSFLLTGTSSLPTVFTHDFQSGSTVIYGGTNTIVNPGSGSFHNLTIQSAGTKTLGGNITINKNLSITGGTLDVSATPYNIDIKGNWSNSGGTFTARTGTVTFSGTTAQSVSTNAQDFYNLTINNTASGLSAITLGSDVTVTNICTMTDGIISTGSNKLIITNTTAANLTGYGSACYVNGNLRRYITNNTSTYGLPVGETDFQLVEIKNNNMTTTSYLDTKFGYLAYHTNEDMSVCDGSLCYQSASAVGMWTIDANADPSSGSYDIYAYIGNMTGIVDNEFAVIKRPTGSTSAAAWIAETAGTINADNGDGRLASHGYALRMGITAFSEFAIGRKQAGGPLPIQLVNFNAETHRDNMVKITWTTASEINNDFFTIERSQDGVNFETLIDIDGAGNSSTTLSYSAIDASPKKGINYYRLKQTDFDGTISFSKIVSVNNNLVSTPNNFSFVPNPVSRGGIISIYDNDSSFTPDNSEYSIEFFNALTGQIIFHQQLNQSTIKLNEQFAPGVYFVKINKNGNTQNHKMIVQ